MLQIFKSETIYWQKYIRIYGLSIILINLVLLITGIFNEFRSAGNMGFILAMGFIVTWSKQFKTEKRDVLFSSIPYRPINLALFRAAFLLSGLLAIMLFDYGLRLILFSSQHPEFSFFGLGMVLMLLGGQLIFDDIKRIFPLKDDYYILIGITVIFTLIIALNAGLIYLLYPVIKDSDWFLYLIFIFWGIVFTGASVFTFTKRRAFF